MNMAVNLGKRSRVVVIPAGLGSQGSSKCSIEYLIFYFSHSAGLARPPTGGYHPTHHPTTYMYAKLSSLASRSDPPERVRHAAELSIHILVVGVGGVWYPAR